jgi:hypothetical protein
MTGPVDEYLSQLRASLRTRPAQASEILAEAEDHLRESVAAGLRAGLPRWRRRRRRAADPVLRGIAAGTAGLLLLAGCLRARRFRQRRSATAAARAAGYFQLAAVIFFGAGTIAEILLIVSGTHVGGLPVFATLALAIGYGIRVALRPRERALAE